MIDDRNKLLIHAYAYREYTNYQRKYLSLGPGLCNKQIQSTFEEKPGTVSLKNNNGS